MIGTPCYGGNVTQGFVLSLVQLIDTAYQAGFQVRVNLLGGDALITRARSQIVGTFLDQPDTTHLLFIDADIAWSPDQVIRLLNADKDMAAAMYPIKNVNWSKIPARMDRGEPIQEAGLVYVTEHCEGDALKTEGDFFTAEYAGTGFLMIKRAALERLIAAYPETQFKHLHREYGDGEGSKNLYALFECMIDQDSGRYLSEDYAFCRRWRAIGGEIWVDRKSALAHTGPFTFAGNTAQRYSGLFGPDQDT
jgi:hypothetical protein